MSAIQLLVTIEHPDGASPQELINYLNQTFSDINADIDTGWEITSTTLLHNWKLVTEEVKK